MWTVWRVDSSSKEINKLTHLSSSGVVEACRTWGDSFSLHFYFISGAIWWLWGFSMSKIVQDFCQDVQLYDILHHLIANFITKHSSAMIWARKLVSFRYREKKVKDEPGQKGSRNIFQVYFTPKEPSVLSLIVCVKNIEAK